MMIRPNENTLIAACIKQERQAQRQLYELFAGKLLVVALRYVKIRADAEDILQESFIKVFKNLGNFRFDCPLEGWLKRIVVNTALKHLQKQPDWQAHTDHELVANEIQSQDYTLSNFHFQELLGFIQSLPYGCRVVFNLYAIEGYQHNEIAGMLGISEGTSKSQYSRARQLLKQQIVETQHCYVST